MEVLAQESELPAARSFDYSRDFQHTLVANPYMWLQIHTNMHTMKVEEEREERREEASHKVHWRLGLAMEVVPWEGEEE